MQKGDPVAVLKRQLEEKEKQLATEQEDAAAARNKLRELSKVSATRPSGHPRYGALLIMARRAPPTPHISPPWR